MKSKNLQVLVFGLLISFPSISQTLKGSTWGLNFGVSFNVGSTVNRIGVYAGGYYCRDFFQMNSTVRAFYNFSTFGPSIKGFELQPSLGILAAFGGKVDRRSDFFSALGNQTQQKYSLGYSYNFYLDEMKTSQRTGTILIGVDRFELVTENDIFGTPASDRFRTGAVKFSYLYKEMMFAVSSILWTGNPKSPLTVKVRNSDFPSRFGYVDFSKAPYGMFSNGILALQFKKAIRYGQELQIAAGLDSEKVRNIFQNKLIHDMVFWPKKWNKARNPHLPMLDQEGQPYLYKSEQKLKSGSFYFDASLNPSIFY